MPRCWRFPCVVMLCSSTAEAIIRESEFTCWMISGDAADRLYGLSGRFLDGFDAFADVFRGRIGLLGEFLDLRGHDRETLAGVSARAASIVAFSANRLVCSAMS